MAETDSEVPKLTPEARKAVTTLFTRAKQVLASGQKDYAIELLMDCCKRDPANLGLRQELRKAEKAKYGDNKRGKPLAFLTTIGSMLKAEALDKTKKYLRAVETAEEVFKANPWHMRAHVVQAHAFSELGLKDLALWTLDQARQVNADNPTVNRAMALLFEERGQFTQAIALWRLVAKKLPKDQEAGKKAAHLAASESIMKGKYEEAVSGGGPTPIKKDPSTTTHRALGAGDVSEEDRAASMTQDRIGKDEGQFLKRIQETPTNANAYLQLAQLYRRHDLPDNARETLKKGLEAIGQNFELQLEQMDLDIDPFRRDLAVTEEKFRADPKNADLANLRAKTQKEINARELALYRAKSDRFPTDAAARYEMTVRLFKTGLFDEAIQEFQKIRSDPKHRIRVLIHLGFCFRARNNWRLAQRNFEEAMQNLTAAEEPYRKELMFQLATGYSENGELPRAVELGCELANLDYSYKNIGPLIDQWQTKLQKT